MSVQVATSCDSRSLLEPRSGVSMLGSLEYDRVAPVPRDYSLATITHL